LRKLCKGFLRFVSFLNALPGLVDGLEIFVHGLRS
jgi:hypothetical protein